jgi:cell wall-associated NlpC family hydrolase
MKAATIVSVAPLRKEAAHRSEMVSELLLGECVEITDSTKDFYQIKSLYDGYEGWCQKSQLTQVDDHFYNNNHKLLTAEPITKALCNGKNIFIPSGCFIGCFHEGVLQINNTTISFPDSPFHFNETDDDVDIYEIVHPYINTPYLWGGKSIFGIDCSGFTQQVFKMLDIKLPRDAYQQAALGEAVGFLQEAQIGDLAFFDNEEGRITHVGILFNESNIIHSSGKVRVDKMDNMGIVNTETGERTHQLRLIKRFLGSQQ